ncbi:MAG: 2-phospho-L-lactate transferase [Alphaproteobacteria bacterium]|nr:2-phospho-L-lactate transferase [Alphaproteobacteria bacterium]
MSDAKVIVLTGGIGGAKLVLGLAHAITPSLIVSIVNTGDDVEHLGLCISPDIDTLLYTLSGKADTAKGWGRADETWTFMDTLRQIGGPDWFLLGDGDLAIHVLRTAWMKAGRSLSEVTADLASRFGLESRVLPMSDDPVATRLTTDEGELEFQRYFVERRCAPEVNAIDFAGAEASAPAPGVIEALTDPDAAAILIAPSNPFLSVDPILAVPGIRDALAAARAPVVAISPLVGGEAVKGPTAKLMREIGMEVSAQSIADHYCGLIDGILIDEGDRDDVSGVPQARCDTLMNDLDDRIRVAQAALSLARSLRS